MRNFKLIIEYDGTDFNGWQVQPEVRTVQGELLGALRDLASGEVQVTGAGRTDAGVHAAGQVASATFDTRLTPAKLHDALNGKLPADVIVRGVEEVPLDFNARFAAKKRRYQYYLIRRQTALWRRHFHYIPGELDIPAMRAAIRALPGERDFTSFASSADTSRTKRCHVMRAELFESPPLLILAVTADRFLHHMVRTIAGTVLEIGRGKALDMAALIETRDRRAAGPTLPPHALYLMEVVY
jgi:tRNA pseudouridine38-40 synthase